VKKKRSIRTGPFHSTPTAEVSLNPPSVHGCKSETFYTETMPLPSRNEAPPALFPSFLFFFFVFFAHPRSRERIFPPPHLHAGSTTPQFSVGISPRNPSSYLEFSIPLGKKRALFLLSFLGLCLYGLTPSVMTIPRPCEYFFPFLLFYLFTNPSQ